MAPYSKITFLCKGDGGGRWFVGLKNFSRIDSKFFGNLLKFLIRKRENISVKFHKISTILKFLRNDIISQEISQNFHFISNFDKNFTKFI